MPPSTIGPYRVIRQLGEGGMGVVYEAVHDAIERRVAIKVLHPEYAKDRETAARFFDEARAVNRIEHPSLVQISDYGHTQDGTAYLIMEFLHGESLAGRLDRLRAEGQRLAVTEVVRIAWQTADALRAAHAKQIVHRDLKPGNLMLVRDPIAPGGERVKILDFGIAKLMQTGTKRTSTGAVMGTPLYMSPEQCRGAGEVDERSDVYSLGVMLYEMLAGRCPFEAAGGGEVLGMHLFKEPPPLASSAPLAPAELVVLTHRLLVKNRETRPYMAAAADELSRIGSSLSTSPAALGTGGAEATRVLAADSAPVPRAPGRASTLGRSVGERLGRARSVRVWSLTGGSVFMVGGALWLVLREPRVPAPATPPPAPSLAAPDAGGSPPPPVSDGGAAQSDAAVRLPDAAAKKPITAASPQQLGTGARKDKVTKAQPAAGSLRQPPAAKKNVLDVD